jgi:hypothetical protein
MRTSIRNTINDQGAITNIDICFYNDKNELVKIEYKNPNNQLVHYEIYEYDSSGNKVKELHYSANAELQSSIEYSYNSGDKVIKQIELTSEGEIWDWTEDQEIPESNLIIYLAKDEKGKIIHKTEENTIDKSQKRFNDKVVLYAIRKRKLDKLYRIIKDELINVNGVKDEVIYYEYKNNTEIKTFYSKGKFGYKDEVVFNETKNIISHTRFDEDSQIENWYSYEYDKEGRKTKHIWKTDFGKHSGFVTYEYVL